MISKPAAVKKIRCLIGKKRGELGKKKFL